MFSWAKALHLEAAPSQGETLKRIRAVQAQAGEYAVRMLGVLNDEQLERVLRFKDASKSAEEQIAALPDHLKKVFESERPLK